MTEDVIYRAALVQASPAARDAFLDSACEGDPALRARVDALLRTHANPEGRHHDQQATELFARDSEGLEDDSFAEEGLLASLTPSGEPGSLGRLDYYEILERIGKGGMGVVFKARDTRLQRIVAIKFLATHLAASGTARQRFFREARAAAAVRDEHVVGIHAVSDDGGPTPYLVMEFIAGITLERRVRERGPLAVKEVLRIGMQAAAGLASAHRQGLIHRDVKPANILLENGVERVKIADFGLARAADDVSLSRSGLLAGTPLYMSPEQARGEALDARSDLFSLGSVLYTLCAGRPAFAADNTMAVLKRVCEETPRPLRDLNPDIPDWLADIVNRLLAKDPAGRFQTAEELKALLAQHLAELQQPRPAPPPREEAPPPSPAPSGPRGPATGKWRRLAAALLLLAGVAILATLPFLTSRPSPSPSPTPIKPVQPAPPEDPRVLTVSKRPQDRARFDTISAALAEVEEGMTVRVLDDADYHECLVITARHRGVTLEGTGRATVRGVPEEGVAIMMHSVPRFTLRGLQVGGDQDQIYIDGDCPRTVLERLTLTGNKDHICLNLFRKAAGTRDAPIVIQDCIFRGGMMSILVQARAHEDPRQPLPCGYLVIRDNTIARSQLGIVLRGAMHQVLVAGNLIMETEYTAVDVTHPLPGAADVLIVNNTLFRNRNRVFGIWDDHEKAKVFLRCKNIRFQNNLALQNQKSADMCLINQRMGVPDIPTEVGDVRSLMESPEWHLSSNWHESLRPDPNLPVDGPAIPPVPEDHFQDPIKVLSRKPDDPDFLRPDKDSPLASGGVGGPQAKASDIPLPAYVGAVPPQGAAPWEWEKTWKAMVRQE